MELSMDYKLMEKRPTNSIKKEAYRCRMCGCTPIEPKRFAIVEESIDGKNYAFDSEGCALMFKRAQECNGRRRCCIHRMVMFKLSYSCPSFVSLLLMSK
jgi:hypothetical protein